MRFSDFILFALLVAFASAIGSSVWHALLMFGQHAALAMFGGQG